MRRKLSIKKISIFILSVIILSILICCLIYNLKLQAVSNKSEEVEFKVGNGSTYYTIAHTLKEKGLIKSEFCYKIYVKFNKPNDLGAGVYKLNKNMSVKRIINTLSKGNSRDPDALSLTFKEGKNMRWIAKYIANNTNNTEEDVFNLLQDKAYLNELINTYWFLTDEILNNNIYYSLEGYLYPNTYEFKNKDVTVKEIFKTLLDQEDLKLKDLKTNIESNKYTAHQIITLASIIELEAGKSNDKPGIAGVFFNRLNSNMPLGSDVTTYYASKVEMSERDLTIQEVNAINSYNTRSSSMAGKLPVGPICSPTIDSIKAVLNPETSNYYFFVADKKGNTYFTKTYAEHTAKVKELKEKGLWYEYEN